MRGKVERIIYANEGSGFTVTLVDFDGKQEVVAGQLGRVEPGDILEGEFQPREHPKYGTQLTPSKVRVVRDNSASAIASWLADNVDGVGPSTAKQIMEAVGDKLSRLGDVEFLQKIKRVNREKAESISSLWRERQHEIEEVGTLIEMGLSNAYAYRAFKHFGVGAVKTVRANPYLLTMVQGIGFKLADEIAEGMGIEKTDPRRLQAMSVYVLDQLASKRGHTAVTLEEFLAEAENIDVSREDLERGLRFSIEKGLAIEEDDWVGLKKHHAAETAIHDFYTAQRGLVKGDRDDRFVDVAISLQNKLSAEQVRAAMLLQAHNLVILTGGPGTGKSHTLASIIAAAQAHGKMRVAVAAPTGKAAARLRAFGIEDASTIHRLLGYKPGGEWAYGPGRPLQIDLLVIDEASMVDVSLMRRVIEAMPKGAKLLLVGDANQLPSVGPGQVFHDLVRRGGPVVRLTRIYRQAEQSPIVKAAYQVLEGRFPDTLQVHPNDPDAIVQRVADMWNAGQEVQVLTPMNRGPLGVWGLNQAIKGKVNAPGSPRRIFFQLGGSTLTFTGAGGAEINVGDPVIGMSNDYDAGIMNGEVGIVREITKENVVINLGDQHVEINRKSGGTSLTNLALAYAITVHRSQGSEWERVVFVLDRGHYVMANREIIYTALTRAKEVLYLHADSRMLAMGVKRRGNNRSTWLKVWEHSND